MNKKSAALSLMVLLMLCFSAFAQKGAEGKKRVHRSGGNGNVTLTGCLAAGLDRNVFTLDTGYPNAQASTGTPGLMPRADATYVLVPEGDVDLVAHTGHKVQVTGTAVPNNSAASAEQPRFKVRSIRHIANSCQ